MPWAGCFPRVHIERLSCIPRAAYVAFDTEVSVKMVTFGGANDAVSWRRPGNPLRLDGPNQPKAAFEAVMRVATRTPEDLN